MYPILEVLYEQWRRVNRCVSPLACSLPPVDSTAPKWQLLYPMGSSPIIPRPGSQTSHTCGSTWSHVSNLAGVVLHRPVTQDLIQAGDSDRSSTGTNREPQVASRVQLELPISEWCRARPEAEGTFRMVPVPITLKHGRWMLET